MLQSGMKIQQWYKYYIQFKRVHQRLQPCVLKLVSMATYNSANTDLG